MKRSLCGLILLAAPLPFLACVLHFFSQMHHIQDLEAEMQRIRMKEMRAQQQGGKDSALLTPLTNADPHYLDKHVESLQFLLPEIKKLEALQLDDLDNETLSKRLQQLKSSHNRLSFAEDQIRSSDAIKEIEALQQHPIEINEEDLKRLLCLIEGVTIWPYGPKEGRPLFIIKDFKLSKKELFHEKVFVVSMQLIKRESIGAL